MGRIGDKYAFVPFYTIHNTYLLYLKRTCSRVTSASSALGVLNEYALTNPRTHSLTQREVTSPSLWPRYDRHFVCITRYNAMS